MSLLNIVTKFQNIVKLIHTLKIQFTSNRYTHGTRKLE